MTASVIAEIGFKINTSDLDKANKEFAKISTNMKAANDAFRVVQNNNKKTADGVNKVNTAIAATGTTASAAGGLMSSVGVAITAVFVKLSSTFKDAAKAADSISGAKAVKEIDNVTAAHERLFKAQQRVKEAAVLESNGGKGISPKHNPELKSALNERDTADTSLRITQMVESENQALARESAILSTLGSVAKTTALAVAAAIAAIGVAAIQTAAEIEKLVNRANAVGLSATEFSKLSFVAEQVGISADTAASAVQNLNAKLGQAAVTGKGKAASALAQLGLDAKELIAIKPQEQIATIAAALNGINTSQRASIVAALGIKELLPLLSLTTTELEKMTADIERLGLAVDKVQVEKFLALDDAVGTLGAGFSAAGRELQLGLAGPLTDATNKLVDMLALANEFKVFETIGDSLGAVMQTFSSLISIVTAWSKAMILGVYEIAKAADKTFKDLVGIVAKAFTALQTGVDKTIDNVANSLSGLAAAVKAGFTAALASGDISAAVNKVLGDIKIEDDVFKDFRAGLELPDLDMSGVEARFTELGATASAEAGKVKAAWVDVFTFRDKQATEAPETGSATVTGTTTAATSAVNELNKELANSKAILEQMRIAGDKVGATVDSVTDAQTLATEALRLGVVYTDGINKNEQAILNTINEKINVEREINNELLKQQETRKNIAAAAEVETINRNAQIEAARARAAETKSDASVFDTGAFTAGPDKAAELESIFKLQEEALARERDLKKQYAEEEIRDKELLEAEKARIDSVYNAQATAMEEEQARQRKAIHQQEVNDRLSVGTELFGRLADVAKAGGKKMGIIAKGAALAQAAISGATAVLKALELGPIYGPPAAAVMAGLVGAQIGIIAATPLAKGGVLDSPQIVGSVGGNPALAGEAGPEAVLPLARGKDGKLGVQMNGGGSNGNTYNFNTVVNGNNGNGQDSQQLAQQIANAQRQMIRQELGEQQRSGNILNPSISKVF